MSASANAARAPISSPIAEPPPPNGMARFMRALRYFQAIDASCALAPTLSHRVRMEGMGRRRRALRPILRHGGRSWLFILLSFKPVGNYGFRHLGFGRRVDVFADGFVAGRLDLL